MLKRYHYLVMLLALLLTTLAAEAQISTLHLRNGSRLRGYIAAQRPGQNLTFHSLEAEMFIDESQVREVDDVTVAFDQLSDGWKREALSQGLLVRAGDGRWSLRLSTVRTMTARHQGVVLKERGMMMKYVQHQDDDYVLSWDDIDHIEKEAGSDAYYDQITLTDGSAYLGTVVFQKPGKYSKVQEPGGNVVVVDQQKIHSSRKVSATSGDDLWQQLAYTNPILLTDGTRRDGIIIYQQVGRDRSDNYIELLREDDRRERIAFEDIVEYRYQPRTPVVTYRDGSVYMDEVAVDESLFTLQTGYVYTTGKPSLTLPQGLPLVVKRLGTDALQGWTLHKLQKLSFERSPVVYGLKETFPDAIAPVSQSSVGSAVASLSFGKLAEGRYVLTDSGHEHFYTLLVTNE